MEVIVAGKKETSPWPKKTARLQTGWESVRLYLLCVGLAVLATLIAAIAGILPHWLWPG
jgi:hypothetical protein